MSCISKHRLHTTLRGTNTIRKQLPWGESMFLPSVLLSLETFDRTSAPRKDVKSSRSFTTPSDALTLLRNKTRDSIQYIAYVCNSKCWLLFTTCDRTWDVMGFIEMLEVLLVEITICLTDPGYLCSCTITALGRRMSSLCEDESLSELMTLPAFGLHKTNVKFSCALREIFQSENLRDLLCLGQYLATTPTEQPTRAWQSARSGSIKAYSWKSKNLIQQNL